MHRGRRSSAAPPCRPQAFAAPARRAFAPPRRSRRRAAVGAMAAAPENSRQDLLIVGPGVLGSHIGHLWKRDSPSATVMGQTNSATNHDRLRKLGFEARTKDDAGSQKFPNVVFCAPPSGSADYPAEVAAAVELWDGRGTLVFTSSAGLYVEDGACDERGAVAPLGTSERLDKLLRAEDAVLSAGGCVVRAVGLYHGQRGAHTFFLRQGSVERPAQSLVNLVHYEDAARLVIAVLSGAGSDGGHRGRIFVASDDHPVTFGDMIAACTESGAFEGGVEFTGTGPPASKRMSSAASRQELGGFECKYRSFVDFMHEHKGRDWYSEQKL